MTSFPVNTGAWVRRYHPSQSATARLICFPHAGGSATYYFPVSRALSPDVEVLAIQYPGRQDRHSEACIDDVRMLADQATEALRPWRDRPVALFGHSMGATVAFEVALRLEAEETIPAALFASGRRAPSRHRDEGLHLVSDVELTAQIQQLSGTDPRVLQDEELLAMVLPVIRSDYKAAETYRYRPGPALSCPVIALTGDRDPKVSAEEAAAWEEHTTGRFSLQEFDGGHFFLNDHAAAVTSRIRDELARPPASRL